MPIPGLPDINSGGGSIPISGTGGAAGPSRSGNISNAPINIAGLFGASASSQNQFLVPALIVGAAILVFAFRKK